jgi:hypothetical protein
MLTRNRFYGSFMSTSRAGVPASAGFPRRKDRLKAIHQRANRNSLQFLADPNAMHVLVFLFYFPSSREIHQFNRCHRQNPHD